MFNKGCSKLESSKVVQAILGIFIITGLTCIVYYFILWAQSPLIYVLADQSLSQNSSDALVDAGFNKAKMEHRFEVQKYTQEDIALLSSKFSSGFFGDYKRPALVVLTSEKFYGLGAKWAKQYPGINFVFLTPRNAQGLDNAESITVSTYGASYLAGILAGQKANNGTVGVVIGQRTPITDEYLAGFSRGVIGWDGSIKVLVEYVSEDSSGFNNPVGAKEIAEKMYAADCSVIFSVARESNDGVVAAAEEWNRNVILADSSLNDHGSNAILASVYRSVHTAVYHAIDDWFEGSFSKDVTRYGLEHGYSSLIFNPRFKDLIPSVMEYQRRAVQVESML